MGSPWSSMCPICSFGAGFLGVATNLVLHSNGDMGSGLESPQVPKMNPF